MYHITFNEVSLVSSVHGRGLFKRNIIPNTIPLNNPPKWEKISTFDITKIPKNMFKISKKMKIPMHFFSKSFIFLNFIMKSMIKYPHKPKITPETPTLILLPLNKRDVKFPYIPVAKNNPRNLNLLLIKYSV